MDGEITIKRLATSRSLRLRVYANGSVVVTAPRRIAQHYIDDFIAEHEQWIGEKRAAAQEKLQTLTAERERLFFRGKEYQFRLNVSTTKPGVLIKSDQLIVTSPTEDHTQVRQVLEKWYRAQAKKHFEARLPLLADLVNRDVTRVSIRDQRSRWGSCSSRRTISLNWRLIQTPDWVSDYVIYHELAHLTHMNHSKAFWTLVESYQLEYKKAERWLKDHHALLQF